MSDYILLILCRPFLPGFSKSLENLGTYGQVTFLSNLFKSNRGFFRLVLCNFFQVGCSFEIYFNLFLITFGVKCLINIKIRERERERERGSERQAERENERERERS